MSLKTKRLILLILVMLYAFRGVSEAQSFDRIAEEVEKGLKQSVSEHQATRSSIKTSRDSLITRLENLKAELNTAQQGLEADKACLKALSAERDELEKEIAHRLNQKQELDAVLIDYARSFLGRAEKSPFSAENPGGIKQLSAYVEKGKYNFGMKDLNYLIDLSFEDMAVSATASEYSGTVLDRSGREVETRVKRLGHIIALHRTGDDVGYLAISPASGRLVMSASPPYLTERRLKAFLDGRTKKAPVDISGGIALSQLAGRVSWTDQLRSGGILVIPILLVGVVALLLTFERLFFLGRVRQNTDALMSRVTNLVYKNDFDGALRTTMPHRNRPTGRVLMAGLEQRGESRSVIESALSEAILRETPRLERFLGALKVSAAVAPLLGLLGTVTGMINTFQVITTHGTGDPRLMAGGISEAMVTTQVGLAVAIPIMIVASFLNRRAHTLSQDMEEKGLALMAAILKHINNSDTIQKSG